MSHEHEFVSAHIIGLEQLTFQKVLEYTSPLPTGVDFRLLGKGVFPLTAVSGGWGWASIVVSTMAPDWAGPVGERLG
ncbi:hypothetical protein, partial [Pacificibacter sp. 1_MG-2023]|uniref:hypothetical protein n=1 Tax=Pacificibacter sp. 1_MG-2023 TaxID=3062658 RepID=UPI0026E20060